MTAGRQEKIRLGFLTAIEAPAQGFLGGLLVTNHLGRPLEFQCTSPVKPNRTQELLYGKTLRPFVLAELIGKTLLEKAGVKPQVVLVEQQLLLELRNHIASPLACVFREDDVEQESNDLSWGRQILRVSVDHTADIERLRDQLAVLPNDVDLFEPFQRVDQALKEALGSGAAA